MKIDVSISSENSIQEKIYNGIGYRIITTPPPNYEEAFKKFGASFDKGIVFTYGRDVHVKIGKLRDDVEAHETVHVVQQTTYPGGPEAWWKRYMEDSEFLLDQELEAYRTQYKFVLKNYPKRQHFEMLKFYAECLSGFYDLGIGMMTAMNLIKK